jgi:hypothetical protein
MVKIAAAILSATFMEEYLVTTDTSPRYSLIALGFIIDDVVCDSADFLSLEDRKVAEDK